MCIQLTASRQTLSALLLGVCITSLCGCGGDGMKRLPVEGTVTVGGKPLRKGTVILHPDDAKGNTLTTDAQGLIDAEGHYSAYVGGKAGVPAGWYRIAVNAAEDPDPKAPYKPPVWLVPERYGNWRTADLAFEVVEKPAAGAYDLKLDAK